MPKHSNSLSVDKHELPKQQTKPAKIAHELQLTSGGPKLKPFYISPQCAKTMTLESHELAPRNAKLFKNSESQYNAHTNVANLRMLREQLRRAYHAQSRLKQTGRMLRAEAQGAADVDKKKFDAVRCWSKAKNCERASTAASYAYNRACHQYDVAREHALANESSEKVADEVAQGLSEAKKAIETAQKADKSATKENK